MNEQFYHKCQVKIRTTKVRFYQLPPGNLYNGSDGLSVRVCVYIYVSVQSVYIFQHDLAAGIYLYWWPGRPAILPTSYIM